MKAKQSKELAAALEDPKSREELRQVLAGRGIRKAKKITINGKLYRVILGSRRSAA
jgi:hypothetical protein